MGVLTVNTNIASLQAQKALGTTQDRLATTIQRLSTGYRINSAKDDSAGLAISAGLSSQIKGLTQGSRNANDGISMVQTAEGALNQTLAQLQRMSELSIQGSSGSYSSTDLANMDNEYQSLIKNMDQNASTKFNGISLLDGSQSAVEIQVGANNTANDRLSITLINATSSALGISGDVTTAANAQASIDTVKAAIGTVTESLATLGAMQTTIEATVSGNEQQALSLSAARSRIIDTDFAEESASLSKLQILQQSGAAMLSQANATAQIIVKLLQ